MAKFGNEESKSFKLSVPANPIYKNILIEAFLINPHEVNQDFLIYANLGNELASEADHDFIAHEIWANGQAIKIESGQNGWNERINTNFTILIVAPNNA